VDTGTPSSCAEQATAMFWAAMPTRLGNWAAPAAFSVVDGPFCLLQGPISPVLTGNGRLQGLEDEARGFMLLIKGAMLSSKLGLVDWVDLCVDSFGKHTSKFQQT
jgi:hypothetical protein